tara:strand:- start:89 stop:322 length:234 start_codon:yes stop_codon:yes gene_type:complete
MYRTLIPRDFENMSLKINLLFIFPISPSKIKINKNETPNPVAINSTALLKPKLVNSPPRKKPTPLSAFLEQVKMATH